MADKRNLKGDERRISQDISQKEAQLEDK